MDFGETVYFLLSIPNAEIDKYLNGKYGHDYEGGIVGYWSFETNEERLQRVENMRSNNIPVPLTDIALRVPSQVIAKCAMTGEVGLCRQIILMD